VKTRAALVAAVTALVIDAYVEPDVRQEAFAVASLLRGDSFAKLLSDLTDQAELEGTPLLAAAEAEIRRGGESTKGPANWLCSCSSQFRSPRTRCDIGKRFFG